MMRSGDHPGAHLQDSTNSEHHQSHLHHRTPSMIRKERERIEEAARLELIVSNAARAMVSVRSTRGATYYHDQGFAAALCAHLQQTMPHPTLRSTLPESATTPAGGGVATKKTPSVAGSATTGTNVVTILSRPIPAQPDDRHWEAVLNQTSGSTELIFAKCPQIVETLL